MIRRRGLLLVFAAILLLIAGLTVSLYLNWFLFGLARGYYNEIGSVRLDPYELAQYPQTERPVLLASDRLVLFYGDSRAESWTPPQIAGFSFITRGIVAQTTAQVLGRFDQHVVPLHPDVIVLQVGINDLRFVPIFPERAEQIISDCISNIDALIARSREVGAMVVITTIFPAAETPFQRRWQWSDAAYEAIKRVNDHLRSLQREGVYVLDSYTILVDPATELVQPPYVDSFMHINDAGYKALNNTLAALLTKLANTP
ncbi:MAG: SGNH/GDSL hydrolase family protein [Anaerolineae bacterium]|nr:SGNH/GDSL hydrolase family protein [Anaerolineae bacterium]